MIRKMAMILCLIAATGLGAVSCDDGGSDGICLADYYGGVQCYDCWSRSLCEESSNRTWIEGISSCPEAGYSDYFGNECGYYQ
jgi:hypothetical protein